MPVVFIEAPPGIRPEAKKRMVEKTNAGIDALGDCQDAGRHGELWRRVGAQTSLYRSDGTLARAPTWVPGL